jgi:hypothetical protein
VLFEEEEEGWSMYINEFSIPLPLLFSFLFVKLLYFFNDFIFGVYDLWCVDQNVIVIVFVTIPI